MSHHDWLIGGTGSPRAGAKPSPCGECARLRAKVDELQKANTAFATRQDWWNEKMFAKDAEVEGLREALRLAMVNAYSPEDVIEIAEVALRGREAGK